MNGLLGAPWVNKLHLHLHFFDTTRDKNFVNEVLNRENLC